MASCDPDRVSSHLTREPFRTFWSVVTALLVAAMASAAERQLVDVTPTVVGPSLSGRDTFRYYCASCHGRDGRGNGPVAASLKTRPPNLTMLAAGNRGQFPAERVKAVVAEGRPDAPAHGPSEMPVWGPIFQSLDPSDPIATARIANVVAYIQSIQAK
jgi:mono/diheme cytochrome c family protein